jgi:hypothetical protein
MSGVFEVQNAQKPTGRAGGCRLRDFVGPGASLHRDKSLPDLLQPVNCFVSCHRIDISLVTRRRFANSSTYRHFGAAGGLF